MRRLKAAAVRGRRRVRVGVRVGKCMTGMGMGTNVIWTKRGLSLNGSVFVGGVKAEVVG